MKNLPVTKNEQYTVEIIDLSHEGQGVAKIEGYPLFIENTLPGEKAIVKVLKAGKKFGYGKVVELLETSPDRVATKDDMLTRTGISPLQHMAYPAQLAFKTQQVRNVMTRIAKLPEVTVEPTLGMENPWQYRNKAQIPVRKVNEELTTGFFRKNSHDLVPLENFYIQDPAIDEAIVAVRDIFRRFKVKPYNEENNTGNLRHIIVRRGYHTGELMLVLVTRTPKLFPEEKIAEAISEALPAVKSIVQNINPEKTNVILGKESRVLYGDAYITDKIFDLQFEIAPESFYQVNPQQTEVMYNLVREYAQLTGEEVVVDAYCGIGTIGLTLANEAKHVYGIESVLPAVINAEKNAELNDITNATFQAGLVEKVLPKWIKQGIKPDVLIVDPPRKGLAPTLIDTLLEAQASRIIYVSCNPSTLARDIQLLGADYEVKKVQPVDNFPQTTHIETVALLQRS